MSKAFDKVYNTTTGEQGDQTPAINEVSLADAMLSVDEFGIFSDPNKFDYFIGSASLLTGTIMTNAKSGSPLTDYDYFRIGGGNFVKKGPNAIFAAKPGTFEISAFIITPTRKKTALALMDFRNNYCFVGADPLTDPWPEPGRNRNIIKMLRGGLGYTTGIIAEFLGAEASNGTIIMEIPDPVSKPEDLDLRFNMSDIGSFYLQRDVNFCATANVMIQDSYGHYTKSHEIFSYYHVCTPVGIGETERRAQAPPVPPQSLSGYSALSDKFAHTFGNSGTITDTVLAGEATDQLKTEVDDAGVVSENGNRIAAFIETPTVGYIRDFTSNFSHFHVRFNEYNLPGRIREDDDSFYVIKHKLLTFEERVQSPLVTGHKGVFPVNTDIECFSITINAPGIYSVTIRNFLWLTGQLSFIKRKGGGVFIGSGLDFVCAGYKIDGRYPGQSKNTIACGSSMLNANQFFRDNIIEKNNILANETLTGEPLITNAHTQKFRFNKSEALYFTRVYRPYLEESSESATGFEPTGFRFEFDVTLARL